MTTDTDTASVPSPAPSGFDSDNAQAANIRDSASEYLDRLRGGDGRGGHARPRQSATVKPDLAMSASTVACTDVNASRHGVPSEIALLSASVIAVSATLTFGPHVTGIVSDEMSAAIR